MAISPPAQAQKLLRRLGLHPRKALGQHFLTDRAVLRRIVAAADLGPGDTVVEVGPGLGMLTQELAARAGWVVAVEVDRGLAGALGGAMASLANVEIVTADILSLEVEQLLSAPGGRDYKVVANLPYNIASAVLRHFLEANYRPRLLVIMVQKEVAQAIVARPGKMGLLSLSVQFYGQPRLVCHVSPRSFYPPPKVHSSVVRIDVHPTPPLGGAEAAGFFRLARAGFSAPRKQLRNSLAQGLHISPLASASLVREAGLDPQRRAQTLDIEEWTRLWAVFVRSPGEQGGGAKS